MIMGNEQLQALKRAERIGHALRIIGALAVGAMWGTIGYIVFHFVAKFW